MWKEGNSRRETITARELVSPSSSLYSFLFSGATFSRCEIIDAFLHRGDPTKRARMYRSDIHTHRGEGGRGRGGREHQCVPSRGDRPHVRRCRPGTEGEKAEFTSGRVFEIENTSSRRQQRRRRHAALMVWEEILVVMRTTESIIY